MLNYKAFSINNKNQLLPKFLHFWELCSVNVLKDPWAKSISRTHSDFWAKKMVSSVIAAS